MINFAYLYSSSFFYQVHDGTRVRAQELAIALRLPRAYKWQPKILAR